MKNNMTKNTDTSRISKPDDHNAMQDNTVKSNVQNVKNENQTKIFKKTGGEEFPDDSSDLHAAVHRPEGCEDEDFTFAGIRPALPSAKEKSLRRRFRYPKSFPLISVFLLSAILLGCLFCRFLMTKDPSFMDLDNSNLPPSPEFLFGTDLLGRDIFSMIWYGGRISLLIGFLSAAVAAVTAVIFGALSGLAPPWLDALLMRVTELILSIPSLLIILLLQATLGEATILSLSLVIGLTGWPGIAKVVRTEVRQIRSSSCASQISETICGKIRIKDTAICKRSPQSCALTRQFSEDLLSELRPARCYNDPREISARYAERSSPVGYTACPHRSEGEISAIRCVLYQAYVILFYKNKSEKLSRVFRSYF